MKIEVLNLFKCKPGLITRVGVYLNRFHHKEVLICWGKGIKNIFAADILKSFSDNHVAALEQWELHDNEMLNIYELFLQIPQSVTAIVAIGGGKVIDICKYLAHLSGLPLFSVPTILSNDGFASPLASLLKNGKKQSCKTRIPFGVIIDTEVLRDSPEIFLYSGIGDLLSKPTAIYDWKLAFRERGTEVNDLSVAICQTAYNAFAWCEEHNLKDLQYLSILAHALMINGTAMTIANSSRPASGSEHLISHAYDGIALKPSLHGLQVAVATFAVSLIQEKTHSEVVRAMKRTGLLEFLAKHPLDKNAFREAIVTAPTIKNNFYTILSHPKKMDQLLNLLEVEPTLQFLLKST